MKSLIYLFRRYKLATLLNVLGLSVAIAAFYLFMTQVEYNHTYNRGLKDHERTFRLEATMEKGSDEWIAYVMRPLETTLATLPHVEAVQSVGMQIYKNPIGIGDKEFTPTCMLMGRPGPSFFGGRMLYGNDKEWQYNNHAAIVTRSEAIRMFGREDAIGQTFTGKQFGQTYTIVGICEDFPDNSMISNGIFICYGTQSIDDNSEWSFTVYARLDKAESKADVEKSLRQAIIKLVGATSEKEFEREYGMKVRLTSLDDTYFSGVGLEDKGNRNLVGVLFGASIFVLLVALLNFINFTLAQAPMRMRGINTRRVMGASTASLRCGIIAENVVLTLIALCFAFLWVMLFATNSMCMRLMSGSISFSAHWALTGITLCAALIIGVVSSLFPAWYATSFSPAIVLKGTFCLSPRGRWLRSAMLFVQFVIAFTLVSYIGVMTSQSQYIFNADYGFNKEEVLFAELSNEAMGKKQAIATELRKLPFVKSTAYGASEMGDGDLYMRWGRGDGETKMNFYVLPVDKDYLQTLGIPIIEGRNFNSSDVHGAYILNRAMMKQYDRLRVDNFIADSESGWGDARYKIVGVCENFRLASMRKDNSNIAVAFAILGEDVAAWGDRCGKVFVRITAGFDKVEAKRQLAKVMEKMDDSQTYGFSFLDERLQKTYQDEFRFIAQVRVFALICMLITLTGVFCLTMFETEYRRKEIALRKVMGSTVGEVLRLFTGRYIPTIVVSFLISLPLGWYLGSQWLQNFAEHAPVTWWIFLISFVLVSAIMMLTIIIQSWKVAWSNPVDSIRTE